ncbi:MAG: Uma2 family endonuclease [Microcystis sp. 49638_E5]|uniref:Uma2 family endonuclease n=1 Tax=Microcystis sp. 49638_E5 TaxID=2904986 RepID=UPI00258E7980|nr:Uma2 family endonuclease [Microcystis sp. 49638_E5]MCE2668903.1 Uma2 family endonuclease [Microcystis sp. 49638_E5]
MIALSNYNNLTPEEYLQFEETSPIKHEYIDGQVYSMGDKFNDYQTLESLEEYVLVNSKHQRVETFRRGEQGLWIMQTYQQESFSLQSINLTASFRDLYEDVTLETVNDTPEST